MTASATPVDAGDPDRPWRAPGLLAPFAEVGLLSSADVHVARRLSAIAGEPEEPVTLAVALTVRALRGGSVCLTLDDARELAADQLDEDASDPGTAGASADDGLPWPEPAAWARAVAASPLVAVGVDGLADRPLRWVDGRLYLDRCWRDELTVRTGSRAAPTGPALEAAALAAAVDRLLPSLDAPTPGDDAARRIVALAAERRLSVLTGGPGTGKTTTVARLVAALQSAALQSEGLQSGAPQSKAPQSAEVRSAEPPTATVPDTTESAATVPDAAVVTPAPSSGAPDGHRVGPLRVALAAPTGKAAARLQEAVNTEIATFAPADAAAVGTLTASTVHRLLGWTPVRTRFVHDRSRPLPHDLVVVDEASMVSLPLMARLLDALRPGARLVLVGDADQLASVEAGAVLGDLVASLPQATVRLTRVHRYGSELAELAEAIRTGRADDAVDLLRAGSPAYQLVEPAGARPTEAELSGLREDVVETGGALVRAARAGRVDDALSALSRHRLLLAHRTGPAGVGHWAPLAAGWVAAATGLWPSPSGWQVGEPLLVTENDRSTGLSNGDTGVVVALPGPDGPTQVAVFGTPGAVRQVATYRLPAVQPVHAMTVHRAQGSQFDRVTVLLPGPDSPLLTRELLYTALTRARRHVRLIGTAEAVAAAVRHPVRRASGLQLPLPLPLPLPGKDGTAPA